VTFSDNEWTEKATVGVGRRGNSAGSAAVFDMKYGLRHSSGVKPIVTQLGQFGHQQSLLQEAESLSPELWISSMASN
jgi:hypothetical protein